MILHSGLGEQSKDTHTYTHTHTSAWLNQDQGIVAHNTIVEMHGHVQNKQELRLYKLFHTPPPLGVHVQS